MTIKLPIMILVLASVACGQPELDDAPSCDDGSCDSPGPTKIFQYYGKVELGGTTQGQAIPIKLAGLSDEHLNMIDFGFSNPNRAQTWSFKFVQGTLPPGHPDPKLSGLTIRAGSNSPLDEIRAECSSAACAIGLNESVPDGCFEPSTCSTQEIPLTEYPAGFYFPFRSNESDDGFIYAVEPGEALDQLEYIRLVVAYDNNKRLGIRGNIIATCLTGCDL